jgi:predicted porin
VCVLGGFATHALAAVSIYGKMHYSLDYVDVDNATGDSTAFVTGTARESRIGFKGVEGLGSDLKAIWQVETRLFSSNNSVSNPGRADIGLRNTFVGLSGPWGTVLGGRHDSPYKMTTSGKVDLFVDRVGDYNNIFGRPNPNSDPTRTPRTSYPFDGRLEQVVMYVSPNFNGFKALGTYQSQFTQADETPQVFSFAGIYESGGLYLAGAYQLHKDGARASTPDDDYDAWKIAGKYTFGKSRVGAIYESLNHDSLDFRSRPAWLLNFSHKFGNNMVRLQYVEAGDSDEKGLKDGAKNYSVAFDHFFSKRTNIYVMYTYMDNDRDAQYGLRNYDSEYFSDVPGGDPQAFSVGLEHKF